MDALQSFLLAATGLGGALCGGLGCHWWAARGRKLLQQRLMASEQARQAAVERSSQARAQIGQLSKALDELKQAPPPRKQVERPAAAEPIPSYELPTLVLPRREPPQAFADTRPM